MGKGGGMRTLQEEKVLLAELGKLFHIARANAREQRNTKRAANNNNNNNTSSSGKGKVKSETSAPTEVSTTTTTKSKTHRSEEATTTKTKSTKKETTNTNTNIKKHRRRKSKRGGSVWIILKGGFARVPPASKISQILKNSKFRGRLSERRRVAALGRAEAYLQTAWQQAKEAGLLNCELNAPAGEEGEIYLREQYEVARGMLKQFNNNNNNNNVVGGYVKRLVEQTIPAHLVSTLGNNNNNDNNNIDTLYTREQWAGFIARENAILHRFTTSSSSTTTTGDDNNNNKDADMLLHEASKIPSQYYFTTAEPLASTTTEVALNDTTTDANKNISSSVIGGETSSDILPTKCIIRIRGSNKQKHTSILSSTKAVNYFKSNFMQVLRKEMNGSKLPRGEEAIESKSQQQQQQHYSGGNSGENISSGGSKKSGKKRQK